MHQPVKNLILIKSPRGDVTQWFAENPDLYARFGMKYHNGVDIVRPHGEPMYAIEDATVAAVKSDPSGFGKHVRIISDEEHNGFHFEWTYGHCSKIHVKVNDKVKAGDHIADMGNTGFVVSGATPFWDINPYKGTHLHFGLRRVVLGAKGGWRYAGSKLPCMSVDKYENGVRGAIDPLPYLKRSRTVAIPDDRKGKEALLRVALISLVDKLQALITSRSKK